MAPNDDKQTNWTGILFGFLLATLAAFQQFKLPPLLPALLAEYAYPKVMAGAFMSIYAVVGLFVSFGLGTLLQRLGTLPILLAAFATAIGGNVLALLQPESATVMLTARGLEGLAFAVFAIAGPVYTNRSAGPRHLPLAIALSAIWIPMGQISANLLVPLGQLSDGAAWGGWRLSWIVTGAATALLAVWMISIRLRGSADLDLRRPAGESHAPLSGDERWALALAALIFTLWSTQYFAYMTWLPQFLVEAHGLSEDWATVGYSVPVVILIVVGLLTSVAIRRGAPLAPMFVASIVLQAAVWWAIPYTTTLTTGIASLVAYGLGIGVTPVCLFALPSTILGSSRAGPSAFAVLMTGRNLGVLIGPILLPQILLVMQVWSDVTWVFAFLTTLCALGALLLGLGLARMGRYRPD
ncbi:MAG: MFS transporter [Alphaproteobacteria bacterium]|nr:MFS transporter [Alphaproteobacteria bacterium]